MITQDANQSWTYWCFGEVPDPVKIFTTAGDYWLRWVSAPLTS